MNGDCKDWTAVKLSSNGDDPDPTKSGFKTKRAAWNYAARWFCSGCRHEMAVALRWKRKYGINPYEASVAVYKVLEPMITKKQKPLKDGSSINDLDIELEMDMEDIFGNSTGGACGCEWTIIPTEKFNKCEGFEDILKAMGAEKVEIEMSKPEGK